MPAALSLWLSVNVASAANLAGVSLPDTASVGGQSLVLNGLGLREKYTLDIYVGALYLPSKTTSGATAIGEDTPKRLVMHFIYSAVEKDKIAETFEEGVARLANAAALKPQFDQMIGWLGDVVTGDEIAFDYVPGQGTTTWFKGSKMGTIPGVDFEQALFSVFLGASPPTSALKAGLLGA